MRPALDELCDSLVREGYALYPYTPEATKNATPTPFGIVYPPAYAEGNAATFDHLRVECVLAAPPDASLRGTVRFLQASGERHEASERRLEIAATSLAGLAGGGEPAPFAFAGARRIEGRLRLRAERLGDDLFRVALCVHNTTPLGAGDEARRERGAALRASLISTHAVLEAGAGRFLSPLATDGPHGDAVAGCRNVNTWPVLAAPHDDAVLAAAIVLPDHPSMAPESLGSLFDATEIEEALLLHVQALSDAEREAIAAGDPAVREAVERAARATPEQVLGLHGRLEEVPRGGPVRAFGHPNPGEERLEAGGRTYRRGDRVVLRPDPGRDVYDRMLAGRAATIERIYLDYEDGAHLAVTVDDDPGRDLFRETGRYLFFRTEEVEPL